MIDNRKFNRGHKRPLPNGEKRVTFSARLKQETIDYLDALAESAGSRGKAIDFLIELHKTQSK